MITPNYLEFSAPDLAASRSFYESALGFAFTDYGDAYAAVGVARSRSAWPQADGSLATRSTTPVVGGSSSSTRATTSWRSTRRADPQVR